MAPSKFAVVLLVAGNAIAADLISAIASAESRGKADAVHAERVGGPSMGILQIQEGTWNDACKRLGVSWSWRALSKSPEHSRVIGRSHIAWLESRFLSATGRMPTDDEVYAMWNMGYKAFRRIGFSIKRVPAVTKRGLERMRSARNK